MTEEGKVLGEIAQQSLGVTLDFLRLLWGLDHEFHRASKRMESSLGITTLQGLVLNVVARYPGITAGQIAKFLFIHPSTLTGTLGRLTRRGLLYRWDDPKDRRRSLLRLTEVGHSSVKISEDEIQTPIRLVLERFNSVKIEAAKEIMLALTEKLSDESLK